MLRKSSWNTFIPVNLIDYLALYPAVDHRMIQYLITTTQNRQLQGEPHTSCNPKIAGNFWARIFLYDRMHFPQPWEPGLKQNVIRNDWVVSNSMPAWRQVYQQQCKKMPGLCLIGLLVSLNMTNRQLQQLVRTARLIWSHQSHPLAEVPCSPLLADQLIDQDGKAHLESPIDIIALCLQQTLLQRRMLARRLLSLVRTPLYEPAYAHCSACSL